MRVALYARYSDDQQKASSIDDQLRVCREVAERHGYDIAPELVFSDAAISGQGASTHKRKSYAALREAVRDGKVDVLISDQQCRLARSAKEALDFMDEMRRHGVLLLTGDGFDSSTPTSQLLFGIKSVFAEFFIVETQHRINRSMVGAFERGDMVTALPYGYRCGTDGQGQRTGHIWEIDAKKAAVVQEMFQLKKGGKSCEQIAAIFNQRGLSTPRQARQGQTDLDAHAGQNGHSAHKVNDGKEVKRLYWRGTVIHHMLKNPMYKGLYQVQFGKRNSGVEKRTAQRHMPALALVTPELWEQVNAGSFVRYSAAKGQAKAAGQSLKSYGGGKSPLSGFIRCGMCGGALYQHHPKAKNGGSLHCVPCEQAYKNGVPGRKPLNIGSAGIRQLLAFLLRQVLCAEVMTAYRERLKTLLEGGRMAELQLAQNNLHKAERTQQRFARLLKDSEVDDPVLEDEYRHSRNAVMALSYKVSELERNVKAINKEAIELQLKADIGPVLAAFLEDPGQPERTRAVLSRIFPVFVLHDKPDRSTSVFEVQMAPGAILAEATATPVLASGAVVRWLRLTNLSCKKSTWSVELIDPPQDMTREEAETRPFDRYLTASSAVV
jgi:DNA invertase Pin-like site-specific DNA recombinase